MATTDRGAGNRLTRRLLGLTLRGAAHELARVGSIKAGVLLDGARALESGSGVHEGVAVNFKGALITPSVPDGRSSTAEGALKGLDVGARLALLGSWTLSVLSGLGLGGALSLDRRGSSDDRGRGGGLDGGGGSSGARENNGGGLLDGGGGLDSGSRRLSGGGSAGHKSRGGSSRRWSGGNGTGGGSSNGSGRGGDGRLGLRNVDAAADHGRTGNRVGRERLVDVEEDAGVSLSVQRLAANTSRALAATAGNLDVEALGIVLSTVGLAGTVKSNNLVTEDVEARRNVGRDLHHPSISIGNQLIRSPLSRRSRAINESRLVNFEELQAGLVNSLTAIRAAVGEVVNDRTLVRFWPGIPLDEDIVSGLNDGMALGVGGISVADDIWRAKGSRLNKAVVGVGGSPAGNNRRVGHVRERVDLVTLVRSSIDDNVCDVAMGSYRSSACKSE